MLQQFDALGVFAVSFVTKSLAKAPELSIAIKQA